MKSYKNTEFICGKRKFTAGGCISVFIYGRCLSAGLEESVPVALVGVAEVLVLNDDHVSVTDFFERAEAQVVDPELSHNHTAAPATKGKEEQEEKTGGKKKKKV